MSEELEEKFLEEIEPLINDYEEYINQEMPYSSISSIIEQNKNKGYTNDEEGTILQSIDEELEKLLESLLSTQIAELTKIREEKIAEKREEIYSKTQEFIDNRKEEIDKEIAEKEEQMEEKEKEATKYTQEKIDIEKYLTDIENAKVFFNEKGASKVYKALDAESKEKIKEKKAKIKEYNKARQSYDDLKQQKKQLEENKETLDKTYGKIDFGSEQGIDDLKDIIVKAKEEKDLDAEQKQEEPAKPEPTKPTKPTEPKSTEPKSTEPTKPAKPKSTEPTKPIMIDMNDLRDKLDRLNRKAEHGVGNLLPELYHDCIRFNKELDMDEFKDPIKAQEFLKNYQNMYYEASIQYVLDTCIGISNYIDINDDGEYIYTKSNGELATEEEIEELYNAIEEIQLRKEQLERRREKVDERFFKTLEETYGDLLPDTYYREYKEQQLCIYADYLSGDLEYEGSRWITEEEFEERLNTYDKDSENIEKILEWCSKVINGRWDKLSGEKFTEEEIEEIKSSMEAIEKRKEELEKYEETKIVIEPYKDTITVYLKGENKPRTYNELAKKIEDQENLQKDRNIQKGLLKGIKKADLALLSVLKQIEVEINTETKTKANLIEGYTWMFHKNPKVNSDIAEIVYDFTNEAGKEKNEMIKKMEKYAKNAEKSNVAEVVDLEKGFFEKIKDSVSTSASNVINKNKEKKEKRKQAKITKQAQKEAKKAEKRDKKMKEIDPETATSTYTEWETAEEARKEEALRRRLSYGAPTLEDQAKFAEEWDKPIFKDTAEPTKRQDKDILDFMQH